MALWNTSSSKAHRAGAVALGFGARGGAFGRDPQSGLAPKPGRSGDERDDRGRDGPAVTLECTPEHVEPVLPEERDRFAPAQATQVLGDRARARVARVGALAAGLFADRAQFVAQARRRERDAVEQQPAERIDVRARTVELSLARLGRGVTRAVPAAAGITSIRSVPGRQARGQARGNAEVEQLEQRSLRRAAEQHVFGFQVAVHDQLCMHVLERVAEVDQMAEHRVAVDAVPGEAREQRQAVEQFHHEPGFALRGGAAIEDLDHVRVPDPRQQRALGREQRVEFRSHAVAARDLERDFVFELAVVARSAIDLGHAAVADALDQAIASDPFARPVARRGRVARELADRLADAGGFGFGMLEHAPEQARLGGVGDGLVLDPCRALVGWQCHGLVEQGFERSERGFAAIAKVIFGVLRIVRAHAGSSSFAAIQLRAKLSSRPSVAGERPVIAASSARVRPPK